MRQISKTFSAAFISIDEESWEEAVKRAQDFGSAYKKASKMVPEWVEHISKESCKMCHLIHQPTAIIQRVRQG